jgi:glycosyltransferase involved in cell wall biosynthesis
VPGPNLNDFFDQVSTHSDQIDLTVLYCSQKTRKWREGVPASSGHQHVFLRNLNPFSRFGRFQINPGVLKSLLWDRPDLIQIQGYTTPTLFLALMLCALLRIPFTYWGEEIDRSHSSNRLALYAKRWIVRCLDQARHVFAVGTRGQVSYQRLGLKHDRVSTLFYSCDLRPFFAVAQSRKWAESQARGIVTTSQLIDRKRIDILVDSFVELANIYPNWSLHVIGEGPRREALEARLPTSLRKRAIWHGYLAKAEHPSIYAQCDIFALPSREDGGPMAMAEALAAGLPVVTTDGVATAQDMVAIPGAGLVGPRDDLSSFRNMLQSLMKNDVARKRCSDAATTSAQRSDAKWAADQYVKMIKSILNGSSQT